MKATLIGFALLMSGTAIAQTTTDTGTMTDADTTVETTTSSTTPDTTGQTTTDTSTSSPAMTDTSAQSSTMTDQSAMSNQNSMTMASNMAPASGAVVQAGNSNPEKDARGITVMSDPATVPTGWNGVTGAAVGGPLVDPATGQAVSGSDSYPACSASVTDNCLQTYERGRGS